MTNSVFSSEKVPNIISNPKLRETSPDLQPLEPPKILSDFGWVSTYPSIHSTWLGTSGTRDFFAYNPQDTAHWYRYYLSPNEFIEWIFNSRNPSVTKYNAYIYEGTNGIVGRLLAQATKSTNPDTLRYTNGGVGLYVFLRLVLASGFPSDAYIIRGVGRATFSWPIYLSNYALNGFIEPTHNGKIDGVEAGMIYTRVDDWYWWYWPDGWIEAQLSLTTDSSYINLDLYVYDSTGVNLITQTTGMSSFKVTPRFRPPPGHDHLYLKVHVTNSYGYNEYYRINHYYSTTGVEENTTIKNFSSNISFLPNFPNPARSLTKISLTMNKPEFFSLKIYNIEGRHIKTLYTGEGKQGIQEFLWNLTDEAGKRVSDGIYFYRLNTQNYSETKKLTIIK